MIKDPYDLHHLDLNVYEIIDDHKVQHLLNAGKRKNIQVPIVKKDLNTKECLLGAMVQISKDNEVVYDDEISEDLILYLEPGVYSLKEVKAPNGYEKIDDITFHVLSTGGVENSSGASFINVGYMQKRMRAPVPDRKSVV